MLSSFPENGLAVILGASGGIGAAVYDRVTRSGAFTHVIGTGRSRVPSVPKPEAAIVDVTQERTIAELAERVRASGLDLRLVFDATGYLHGHEAEPEKTWSAIDPQALAHQFAVNATGPALMMKHLLPLFPRDGKATFATISAKVGSIGDNRLGGWYGYRAAKAALNQMVRTASIELARKRPHAVCIALHPGTVDTPLSAPFAKAGLALQQPQDAAASLVKVIDEATPAQSGLLISYDGTILPY